MSPWFMTRVLKEGLPRLLVEDRFGAHPKQMARRLTPLWTRRPCGWLGRWPATASPLPHGPTPTIVQRASRVVRIPGMLVP